MTSFLSRMNETRYMAAGAHHPQRGFLVSGGLSRWDTSGILSSSELSTDGTTFRAYTPLPIGLVQSCMVALEGGDGEFFLAGGSDAIGGSNKLDRAFIHRSNNWVEVTPMPTARFCKKSN